MVEQHFCLRWNNYRTNITAEFEVLREGQHFVDVTLACDGHQLKAHKVVLSACSPYFKDLLQGNPCNHPIIILRDVAYLHMQGLLEFMYAGEVNVSQAHLASFLRTAEALKVRGLAEAPQPDQRAAAAAAVAAAAVTNSVADLLALKSSIGNLPLGPLSSTHQQHTSHRSDAKNYQSVFNISENSSNNVEKRENKSEFGGDEPLPLTVNNNIKAKDLRSPSPHHRKKIKFSHGGSESSAPSSPQSYYVSNTPHSNGSTGDIPSEDIAHDLSNTGKQSKNKRVSPSNGNAINTSTSSAITVASLPPSLIPSSSPEHMQYAVKSEPLDRCGAGSDNEVGGCGGSWHEDSVGSDGECKGGGETSSCNIDGSSLPPPPASRLGAPHQRGGIHQHSPLSSPPHAPLMMSSLPPQESHLAGCVGGDDGWSFDGVSMVAGVTSGVSYCSDILNPPPTTLYSSSPCSSSSVYPPPPLYGDAGPSTSGSSSGALTVSREVPQNCPYCSKVISNFYNLKKHISTMHQSPAVYQACSHCSAAFRTPEYLRKHLVNVHKYPVKKKK